MTRFLKLSSCLLFVVLLGACSPYRHLTFHTDATESAMKYKPVFDKKLYRCVVDGHFLFKKFHLSGLLFFKKLEDKSTRVVFQNEMGFAFFDFEWDKNDSFKVNQIIPQLDKPALVKTLQKDLSIVLFKDLDKSSEVVAEAYGNVYNRFSLVKGFAYYISKHNTLQRIENTGKRKRVTTITMDGNETVSSLPDTVLFNHHRAHFTIQLNKITPHADE